MREILRWRSHPVSLDKPVREEDDAELGDSSRTGTRDASRGRATHAPPPRNPKRAGVAPRARAQVIELRFGLTGGEPCTLEEVAEPFGVTRERIRQIENNTLKKLEGAARGAGSPRLRLAGLEPVGRRLAGRDLGLT